MAIYRADNYYFFGYFHLRDWRGKGAIEARDPKKLMARVNGQIAISHPIRRT
jgi:hypothetical protein